MSKTELDLCRELVGLMPHHLTVNDLCLPEGLRKPRRVLGLFWDKVSVYSEGDIFHRRMVKKSDCIWIPEEKDLLEILRERTTGLEVYVEFKTTYAQVILDKLIDGYPIIGTGGTLKEALLRAVIVVLKEVKE